MEVRGESLWGFRRKVKKVRVVFGFFIILGLDGFRGTKCVLGNVLRSVELESFVVGWELVGRIVGCLFVKCRVRKEIDVS